MSSRRESDFVRLTQLLREAEQRAQEAEKSAEQDRMRAEELKQRVEQDRSRVEELEELEQRTKRTTFKEYIRACHTLLSKPLRIQTNKRLCTKGTITNPKNKPCPTLLKPWTEFPELQQQLFERICEYIPQEAEPFSSVYYLTELGGEICDRPLGSEKDLEAYQRLAVERPTTHIIAHLRQIEEARQEFNLRGGIIFENHANTLSDRNEEVEQSLQDLQDLLISSEGHDSSSNPKPRNADQICVYQEADGTLSLCMVVEYKPAHKLSVLNLRAGLLRANEGSMNIPEDVINRIIIPTDPKEKFTCKSEWLTAAALTQTYTYMLENGLEYSKLATGEADVFLQVREDEPHTLYYHLAEPSIEAEAHSEVDILLCRTAVGQTLTFCLMALDSKPRSQNWRNHAIENAYRCGIDIDAILQQMPDEGRPTPPPSAYHARIHPVMRSPYETRSKKPLKARGTCRPTDETVQKDPQSPSDSSDETSNVETPSKPRLGTRQSGTGRSGTGQTRSVKSSQAPKESDVYHRQYCTQACLLGLVRRLPLDDACPNVNAHRAHKVGNHHAFGRETLARLMLHQLTQDPDDGCEPLGKQGARGALFRLTLGCYGYTFVAKCTVTAFEEKLKYEGSVYQHLDQVQGELIPVYLGNIHLARPYFLAFEVRIVHMLLLSWAGEEITHDSMLAAKTWEAVAKLSACGVKHGDVRLPNVLWNPETRNVMLVDFERSEFLKQVSVLQETSPSQKRKCLHSDPKASCRSLSNEVFINPGMCFD